MTYYETVRDYFVRNEINHRVKDYSKNKSDLDTYYNVGKIIVLAQGGESRAKYGDGLIKEYSERLTKELEKNYSTRTLKYARKFYLFVEKGQPLVAQLSWSHYVILLSLKNVDEINYYINLCIENNLSKRELQEKLKNKEYERLDDITRLKLIQKEELKLSDTIKNPVIIPNPNKADVYKEKILGDLIMENLDSFLSELGNNYYYVGREYKISLEDRYNYIDFLLYNKEYRSYVVIELKIGELKKEHVGQIELYTSYIDENVKEQSDNETIGIILCKKNNKLVIGYCSNPNITSREFVLTGSEEYV